MSEKPSGMTLLMAMHHMLESSCPSSINDEGVRVFWFESHCVGWRINATLDSETGQYDILELECFESIQE